MHFVCYTNEGFIVHIHMHVERPIYKIQNTMVISLKKITWLSFSFLSTTAILIRRAHFVKSRVLLPIRNMQELTVLNVDYFDSNRWVSHLEFLIAKLTAKLNDGSSLSKIQSEQFQASMEITLGLLVELTNRNMNKSTDPVNVRNIDSVVLAHLNGTEKMEEPVFSSLHDKKSTWEIDGMESMSTEEYYAALNKRNADIRARLRKNAKGGGAQQVDSYINSLNSKRTSSAVYD